MTEYCIGKDRNGSVLVAKFNINIAKFVRGNRER
jgi:hypothetical protein